MLSFPEENSFYFLQVLKRRKDNPGLEKDMIHIADYYIYSIEQFDVLIHRVIDQCDSENARAYFRLNTSINSIIPRVNAVVSCPK